MSHFYYAICCSVQYAQLHVAILLHDKVAWQNQVADVTPVLHLHPAGISLSVVVSVGIGWYLAEHIFTLLSPAWVNPGSATRTLVLKRGILSDISQLSDFSEFD